MIKGSNAMYFDNRGYYANAFLAVFASILTIVIPVLGVIGVFAFKSNIILAIYLSFAVMLLIVLFIFLEKFFVWAKNGRLIRGNKKVTYEYEQVISTLGNSTINIEINDITRVKRKGRNLVVYGWITEKDPLRKRKKRKKCMIYNIDDESVDYLLSFFPKMRK